MIARRDEINMKRKISTLLPISIMIAFVGTGVGICLAHPTLLGIQENTNTQTDDTNSINVKSAQRSTSVTADFVEDYNTVYIDMNAIQGVKLNIEVNAAVTEDEITTGFLEVNVAGAMGNYIFPSFAGTDMNKSYVSDYVFNFDFLDGTYASGKTSLEIPVEFDWVEGMKPSTMDQYKTFVSSINDGTSAFEFTVSCSI
jgi:hypothetical protein